MVPSSSNSRIVNRRLLIHLMRYYHGISMYIVQEKRRVFLGKFGKVSKDPEKTFPLLGFKGDYHHSWQR